MFDAQSQRKQQQSNVRVYTSGSLQKTLMQVTHENDSFWTGVQKNVVRTWGLEDICYFMFSLDHLSSTPLTLVLRQLHDV